MVNIVIDHMAISIHALLAESDSTRPPRQRGSLDFYPRSPCGERLGNYHGRVRPKVISIHALLAESDAMIGQAVWGKLISIHALLAESDRRAAGRRNRKG